MKESEKIQQAINETDNDLRAFGLQKQYNRAVRLEEFEEKWLPILQSKCKVHRDGLTGRYTFELNDFGVIDFYPKANRLLIRQLNKWQSNGLNWLIKQLKIKL